MSIGTANMDGSLPPGNFFVPMNDGPIPGVGDPGCGIAVNDTHLYWHGYSSIARVSLDETPFAEPLVPGIDSRSCGLAIDRLHVYWTEGERRSIGRASLDGSGSNLSFISAIGEPCGLAVDDQYIYWSERFSGRIGRALLDGTEVERDFIEGFDACGLAVNDRHIYWGGQSEGGIRRAKLDGSDPDEAFIAGPGSVSGLATNSTHLFWADERYEGYYGQGSIGRAALDGSSVELDWIPRISNQSFGVAVDSRPEPPRFSLRIPSRPFKFGKLKINRRTGVAYLPVYVPASGELSVEKPNIGWKVLKGPRSGNPIFTWHVKIWPGKKGRVSKRIKRQLASKGCAPVTLRLTYAEENKGPVTGSQRIVLVRLKNPPKGESGLKLARP